MIEIINISAGYGKDNAIEGISLTVPKGRLLAVIGPNGSGKSTLLKTAVGILQPRSGEIILDGIKSKEMSRQDTSKKVAYLTQGRSVPDMTVGQLVLHGRFPHLKYPRRYGEDDREIAHNAMAEMGISDLADRTLSSLSGGMRQNAYIAMALAQDTDYIMLDEPTTYLDISHQLTLMKTLRALADGGKGVITVMHDLPLAFSCSDSVAVLRNGRIAICGTPEEVCKCGVIENTFGVGLQYSADENNYHYQYSLR